MSDEPGSTGGDVASAASSGSLKSKAKDFLSKMSGGGKGGGGSSSSTPAGRYASIPSSLKRGGKIKRTGLAKVHKGERVLTKRQVKAQARKRDARKKR